MKYQEVVAMSKTDNMIMFHTYSMKYEEVVALLKTDNMMCDILTA